MTIPTSTTSAVCRLLRGILCSVLALFAAGCVSWMDSETIEKDVPETWEAVQLSDGAGAERTIESLAIYKIGRGSKLRAGLRHLVEPGSTDVAGEEIVLGPGDLVHGSAATSKNERRTDVVMGPAGAVGPVVVSPVKAILLILGLEAKGFPASRPNPFTTFKTPAGRISHCDTC